MKIETKYDINDNVRIIELGVKAVVKSISITNCGIEYEVSYFNSGIKRECNVLEVDLESFNNETIGIKE